MFFFWLERGGERPAFQIELHARQRPRDEVVGNEVVAGRELQGHVRHAVVQQGRDGGERADVGRVPLRLAVRDPQGA